MSSSDSSAPETVIAIYRVSAEHEKDFFALLRQHYPTLRRLDLVTDQKPVVYRGEEHDGGPIVFEIFEWKNGAAAGIAHETPEVAKIWEGMGTMVESRDGRPKFEFPHVKLVENAFDPA